MGFTRNVVSFYGLDPTGVADIVPTLTGAIKTDLTGQDTCVLTFPAGTYKCGSFTAGWIPTVDDLTLSLAGATLDGGASNGIPVSSLHLAQIGIDEAGGQSARIQTAPIGARSVTLTTASASAGHISRFSVGQWIMVAGWQMLGGFAGGGFGFPPNFHWNEYVQITGITSNTITFDPPLQNFYDANWPELNRGGPLEIDGAGPATIFALPPAWSGKTTLNSGTLTQVGTLINAYRRTFEANGVTCTTASLYPSDAQTFRAINCIVPNVLVEADKNIDLVDIRGGTWSGWNYQSSSTRRLTMSGVTITNGLIGSPRNAEIRNCAIGGNLRIGPYSYGRGETFICADTSIAGTITGGYEDKGPRDEGYQDCLTMSASGVLTVPFSLNENLLKIIMPDVSGRNVLFWAHGSFGAFAPFKALSATSDTWPAVDNQTTTTNVTMSSVTNTRTLTVSSNIFSPSDVGKIIKVGGVGSSGGTLLTFIKTYTSATSVDLFDPCLTTKSASSQTVQWGTCNYYIQTDQTGMPNPALYSGSLLKFYVPPVRTVSFENCTGSEDAIDLSQAAARNRPFRSYTKRVYTGTLPATDVTPVNAMGTVVSIKINVTKAYTGVGSLTFIYVHRALIGGTTFTLIGPTVNLKAPLAERVITPSGVTGAQTGDSGLTLTVPTFLTTTTGVAKLSRDISGEASSDWPEFTIEVITDQGFPTDNAFRLPLRFRAHA